MSVTACVSATKHSHSSESLCGANYRRRCRFQASLIRTEAADSTMADDHPSMDEVRLDDVKVEDTSKDSVKPRAARTTAIKVTAGLLAKVASGFCGADLKITGIMPHESLSQLCDALVGNVVTRRLDLEGCGVGDRGCIFIRDLLLKNRTIETLDLKLNQISDAGVKLLADAMQKSASIQMLFLNDNDVTDLGVQHLLAALQNGCGCFVSLRGCCRVSPAMLQELEDFVEGTTVQSKPVIPDRDSKEKKRDADPEKSDKIKTTQPEQVKVATPKAVAPVSPKRANVVVVAKFSDFQVIFCLWEIPTRISGFQGHNASHTLVGTR